MFSTNVHPTLGSIADQAKMFDISNTVENASKFIKQEYMAGGLDLGASNSAQFNHSPPLP